MASASGSGGARRTTAARPTVNRMVASQREAGRVTPSVTPAASPGSCRQTTAGCPRANQWVSVARASGESGDATCTGQDGESQARWCRVGRPWRAARTLR